MPFRWHLEATLIQHSIALLRCFPSGVLEQQANIHGNILQRYCHLEQSTSKAFYQKFSLDSVNRNRTVIIHAVYNVCYDSVIDHPQAEKQKLVLLWLSNEMKGIYIGIENH